ncbi:phosphoribosylaminoimidazolesuccinocarboxamide synthase [Limnoglobus roseus]|uniref:Phosphoribosylaminoimidazole-succinocarboxamide synthase n=1 Tax=Limnoglobus roseus TaxID=2598579 RepID=A0A5C1ABL7_9BACT|nr:phosphoribosylaminoimidazolesuccinocarboxamide synthase [Limnoglobus roseus]QEL14534.1 phosphoribosylaminoimidazolesuccinocarboxamide synthase [Limnoglobus roseus]
MLQSDIPGVPRRQGKVRDVYDLGDTLVIVATDRVSAFDWVIPPGIPGKGKILTAMAKFWFDLLKVPNHYLSDDVSSLPAAFQPHATELAGRTMIVKKTTVVPIECVARGYILGTGWKEYRQSGTVCGIPLPAGLKEADRLPEPIFTPATKAETGHDENISFERMVQEVGQETADELRSKTLDVYRRAAEYAEKRGIILADTKLEWGRLPSGEIILIDEVLTPDSSRFWPKESYRPGGSPPSFDKQFLRDWLETTTWDKASPPPELPADIVAKTAAKYREALERLTR